jgi:hypothetical protein
MQTESSYCRIRPDALASTIRSKDLKRWWVAEVSGLHKTTLRRWMHGRAIRVRRKNAERLAHVLEVPVSGFTEPATAS